MSVISSNIRIWMWRTNNAKGYYSEHGTAMIRATLLANVVLRRLGVNILRERAEAIEERLPWGNPPMTQDAWLEECRRADIQRLHRRRVAPVGIDDLMAQQTAEDERAALYAAAMERAAKAEGRRST